MEKSSADAVRAELQVLLAEIKRLSMHQERLKEEVDDIHTWKANDAAATPTTNKIVPKLHGCKMPECLGRALTVPVGRHNTASSSDWSEAAAETPIRNVVSGVCYAVDTLCLELRIHNLEGAVPSCLHNTVRHDPCVYSNVHALVTCHQHHTACCILPLTCNPKCSSLATPT